MEFIWESDNLTAYLSEWGDIVHFSNPVIKKKTKELFQPNQSEIEKVKVAFEFVRDEIDHSWDIQGKQVTCDALDVLTYKEGICYAKSNLLASLLRSQGIPTGFCYQRLMLFDIPEKGYCIHALNAVYLQTHQEWKRIDARGNKQGIDAQFTMDKEQLAFTPQEHLGEKDYLTIFARPHPKTIAVLKEHTDVKVMYEHYLPQSL